MTGKTPVGALRVGALFSCKIVRRYVFEETLKFIDLLQPADGMQQANPRQVIKYLTIVNDISHIQKYDWKCNQRIIQSGVPLKSY